MFLHCLSPFCTFLCVLLLLGDDQGKRAKEQALGAFGSTKKSKEAILDKEREHKVHSNQNPKANMSQHDLAMP